MLKVGEFWLRYEEAVEEEEEGEVFFSIRLPSGLLPVLGPLEAVHDSYT